jgi:hypothetical protein
VAQIGVTAYPPSTPNGLVPNNFIEKLTNKQFVELIFEIRGTIMKMKGTKTNIHEKIYLWG